MKNLVNKPSGWFFGRFLINNKVLPVQTEQMYQSLINDRVFWQARAIIHTTIILPKGYLGAN